MLQLIVQEAKSAQWKEFEALVGFDLSRGFVEVFYFLSFLFLLKLQAAAATSARSSPCWTPEQQTSDNFLSWALGSVQGIHSLWGKWWKAEEEKDQKKSTLLLLLLLACAVLQRDHGCGVRGVGAGWTRLISRARPAGATVVDGPGAHSCTIATVSGKSMPGHGHHAVCGAHLHVRRSSRRQAAGANTQDHLQVWAHERYRLGVWQLCLSHGASPDPHVQRKRGTLRNNPFLPTAPASSSRVLFSSSS